MRPALTVAVLAPLFLSMAAIPFAAAGPSLPQIPQVISYGSVPSVVISPDILLVCTPSSESSLCTTDCLAVRLVGVWISANIDDPQSSGPWPCTILPE
jgi:hypothetical protein